MKVKELYEHIKANLEGSPHIGELEVKVLVREKGSSFGARPSAIVEHASFGFDHENGLLLATKKPLQIIK